MYSHTPEWWEASAPNGKRHADIGATELCNIYGEVSSRTWQYRRMRARQSFPDIAFSRLVVGKHINQEPVAPLSETTITADEESDLERLLAKGYQLVKEPQIVHATHEVDVSRFDGKVVRFGVVSDTHLCSKYQQLTHLKTAYELFEREGITDVIHAGDMVAGNGRVYRGQVYELFAHGADETCDYAIEHYPRVEGITTHIISGNHDLSFVQSEGCDVVKRICSERDDLNYLGQYSATVQFGNLRVGVHHGAGGGSYARSYKLQKLIEQLAPENKPHALMVGHYHCTAGLEMYRNVFARQLPCFEAQTPFLSRLGLYPEIGFYIVKALMNATDREDGVTNFRADYYPFYIPHDHDY